MRRKEGSLVPLEEAILVAAADLKTGGQPEVHGYLLARAVEDLHEARRLTAYGTLYKALGRLERDGYLASRWEDPQTAADEGRPRRRFYRLTAQGERMAREARAEAASVGPARRVAMVAR
jgi:PadR family transcriptional regulator, regulatory protein PadR